MSSLNKGDIATASEGSLSVEEAKKALDDANLALATAQANYDNSVTAEANSVIGFYKSLGTRDGDQAAEVYKYYNQLCEDAGYDEVCFTQIGVEGDATSLTNVMKSLDYIDECNELRVSNGLSELKITPMIMAMAEANANRDSCNISHWSQDYLHDDYTSEWYRHRTGENLAWNFETITPTEDGYIEYGDPFYDWYTIEKAYYVFKIQWNRNSDSETYGEPDTSYEYYQQIVDGIAAGKDRVTVAEECEVYPNGSGGSTGHYTNIVEPIYEITGFAVCSKEADDAAPVHVQKFYFSAYSNDTVYTVSEYRTLLQNYINKLDTYKTALDNAKKAVEEAETTYHLAVGHTWNAGEVTTQPTCTTTGVKKYTCTECEATKTETVKALGHNYSTEWTVDTKATCTKEGSKSHHCTRCDSKTDVTSIAKTAHSWNTGKVTKEPTCTDKGVKTYTCTECNASKTEEVEALGHSYSEEWIIDVKPTFTTKGYKSHKCIRCDARSTSTEIDFLYFTDVDSNTFHADDIDWLAKQAITEGWTTGERTREYRPMNEVARADMAAFLHRLADLS